MIHWTSLVIAIAAGGWTALREPAQPLFEQSMRALALSGPGLQLLAMVYWTAEVTFALAATYVLATLLLRAVVARLL